MSAECSDIDIPTGYKQTEVGVIPEDWNTEPLRFDVTLLSGQHVLAQHCNTSGDGVPYLTGPADFPNGNIQQTKFTNRPTTLCKAGDILVTVKGSGSGTLIESDDSYCISRQLMAIRVKEWNAKFLFYSLLYNAYKIKTSSTGLIPGLSRFDVLDQEIPLPPTLEEQEAIAKALSDTDALIKSLEQLISKKRQIKQGAMQELLTGKRRLPGFGECKGYKQTDLGVIPEDWDVVNLADVGRSLAGLTYSPSNVRDFGTLVLRSSNVQNGKLVFEDNVYVDIALPERVIVEKDDILICVRNGSRQLIGKCALIDESATGNAFGAFMSIYRSKYSKYVFHQFQSEIIQRQINEIMGATINQITNKDMASFIIPFPHSDEEKNVIVSVLSDMNSEITALEEKLAKARQIKQGMMQELLTGRVRLI